MDPPSEAPSNSIQLSLVTPITPSSIITDQANNGIETHSSSYPTYEPNIRQIDYWQQIWTDLYQSDLKYSTWSKSMKVLEDFLDDPGVLQQSCKLWNELRSEKGVPDLFTKEHSTTDTNWLEFYQKETLDVVLNWDPFDSSRDTWNTVESVLIFSTEEYASTGINDPKDLNYAMAVSEVISSYLKDLFQCLINANSAFHSAAVTQKLSFDPHPSCNFCTSSYGSSMSTERGGSYMSSLSSPDSTSTSSYPINISTSMIDQQRPTLEIEPIYEEENISGGMILDLFREAISNLKHLANNLVHKKCGHVLSKAFQGAFEAAMEQKLEPLGFHHRYSTWKKLQKLESIEASALKERRRDWEKTFKIVVNELLPWPKFLCEEIFSEYTLELKEACFFEYAELCLMPLLEFANQACSAMPSRAERISHQLYVYEVLGLLSHKISPHFLRPQSGLIRQSFSEEVRKVLQRLKEAILEALADFMNQILDDQSCINNNEVDAHHLTCTTMSYMKGLSFYRKKIDSILYDGFSSSQSSSYTSDVKIDASGCHEFMLLLISCLETKLMEKYQFLKDSVAAQVFWINNLDYIIEQVTTPQLRIILGEEWVQKQNEKIEEYLARYKNSVTIEVQSCLVTLRGSADKKLNSLKSSIEERCKVRASWKVPNPSRRDALRNAALDVVVLVYTNLWYELHPGMHKNIILEISIEEELEYLKSRILDLFEG